MKYNHLKFGLHLRYLFDYNSHGEPFDSAQETAANICSANLSCPTLAADATFVIQTRYVQP